MFKNNSQYYQQNAKRLGWSEEQAKLDQERVQLINRFVKGEKVLDVGCGFGVYVDYLAKKGFEAYGVDIVSNFIVQAQKSKQGRFIRADSTKLPFDDNFFDSVVLFDLLEHGDDGKILAEAKRVAKKQILVIVPREVDRELADVGVVFRHYIDKSHLREYTPRMIEELAKKAKLNLDYLQPVHPLNNKIIFIALFRGQVLIRDIIRKLVFWLLPRRIYPSEYFAVLTKK